MGMMLESGYSNQIKYKDLKKIVEKLWENYPPKLPPYQDSMQGNRITSPLLERMNENNDAFETILKDVRTGGILVQDLSGRDLFKFSHKSYLEYLISFFYTGYLLQSEDDKYLLIIINGIKKALNFSSVRLKPSMEVERFTSELIMSGIKLSDKREDANNDYSFLFSKKLFNILISSSYPMSGKFFPRIKFWLTLNSDTWLFVFITLLSTFLFLLANTIELKHLNKVLYACLSITFAGTVILSIFRYKVKNQHLVSKTSDYLSKLRIYLLTLRLLGFFDKRFSSRQKLIIEHSSKPELISSIGILILSISLSFSASLTLFFIMSSVHVFFDSSTISPVALVAFSVAFAALPTLIGVDLFNGIGIAAGIGAGLFVTVGSILIYFIASPLLNIPKEMSWMIFLINTLLLLAVISNLYWRELKKLLLSLKNRHS